jgi:Predicted permease.
MRASFKKVFRDLLGNKSRSLIVLLAIILGAFGVSMMTTAYNMLGRNLSDNYLKTNPAAFTLVVDSISDEVLQKTKLLPEIEYIESRNKLIGRVETGKNEFVPIWLYVVDDLSNIKINTYRLLSGTIPTSEKEILIERTGNRLADIAEGRHYPVTIPGFGTTDVKISGIVHDPGQAPSWMEGLLYGYVSRDFVKSMNITGIKPELKFTIRTSKYNISTIEKQMAKTVSFLESNRIKINRTEILTPGTHIHQSQMDSLMFLLQMFGMLALILSCFLIINMIMAIMAKETRQIGVMKAIGASTEKITSILHQHCVYIWVYCNTNCVTIRLYGRKRLCSICGFDVKFRIIQPTDFVRCMGSANWYWYNIACFGRVYTRLSRQPNQRSRSIERLWSFRFSYNEIGT